MSSTEIWKNYQNTKIQSVDSTNFFLSAKARYRWLIKFGDWKKGLRAERLTIFTNCTKRIIPNTAFFVFFKLSTVSMHQRWQKNITILKFASLETNGKYFIHSTFFSTSSFSYTNNCRRRTLRINFWLYFQKNWIK